MGDKPINLLESVKHSHSPEVGQMEFLGLANFAEGEGMIGTPRAVFASYYEGADGNVKRQILPMPVKGLETEAQRQRSENFETFPHNERQFIEAYKALGENILGNKKRGVPHDDTPVYTSVSEYLNGQAQPAEISAHREAFKKVSSVAEEKVTAAPALAAKSAIAIDPQVQADAEAVGMTARLPTPSFTP